MKPELYGKLNLNVSKEVNSENEVDVLGAAYSLSDMNIDKIDLVVTDDEGNKHVLCVNGWELRWEKFFGQDES